MKDQGLIDKINQLFNYREFPYLFDLAKATPNQVSDFHHMLVELQSSIYYLDADLESQWDLSTEDLKPKWDNIYNKMGELGLTSDQSKIYCAHIMKYQKHELELRSNVLPTRFKMEFFYFYKSCDVKLLRKLIYDYFPNLKKHSTLSDWRYFDLITEVNDDVEDIFEDTTTINGNRFLISAVTEGSQTTKKIFINFCDYIMDQSIKRFDHKKGELHSLIHQKTIDNINDTKKLIEKNLKDFQKLDQTTLKLFQCLGYFTEYKTG